MPNGTEILGKIQLTDDQQNEGYWVEEAHGNVLVWHRKNQIALLLGTNDIQDKVQRTVENRRKELKEVEARTGWKAS